MLGSWEVKISSGKGANKPKKNMELNHGSSLYVLDIAINNLPIFTTPSSRKIATLS
jgi:hypothetical protein